jgi:thioredoxin-like negative regulator of GroEL
MSLGKVTHMNKIRLIVLFDAEGKTVQRFEGTQPEAELDAAINTLLEQNQ